MSAVPPQTAVDALPPESWRQRYPAFARFVRNPASIVAFALIVLLAFAAFGGPLFWKIDPTKVDLALIGEVQSPSSAHPAGTDPEGRDLFARLLLGGRISLTVGLASMLINLVIGVGLGTLAGWLGGWIDAVLMRLIDALYSIPILLIVILLQVFVKPVLEGWMPPGDNVPLLLSPDLMSIYLALGISNWLTMARLARGEVLHQKTRDYVLAGRSIGIGPTRLLLRHVLPNSFAPLLVAATLAIPEAIFVEAFLSFIGLGVSPPLASWGSLASDALVSIKVSPHLLLFPAVAISLTMLAFNILGDGLRDAFDPKGRK